MFEKRIMLIESGQFIGGVFLNLFQQQGQGAIIEVAPSTALDLVQAVQKHRPQIVVLDDTVENEFLSELLRYMQGSDGICVVVVGTENNSVAIYQKQQINVKHSADFFAAL